MPKEKHTTRKKLKLDYKRNLSKSRYCYLFYDHSASDNAFANKEHERPPTIINLVGWELANNDLEYIVEVVRASDEGNSLVWHILKSAVIDRHKI